MSAQENTQAKRLKLDPNGDHQKKSCPEDGWCHDNQQSGYGKKPDDIFSDDKHYFRSYADIGIHEEMISDRIRTTTYRLAILKNHEAIRGKVVLDIGAGTGILSMFCLQAGAKKVYAVEASDMASAAELVFKENKVSDKATVVRGKMEEVELPEKVDVIVSEWMGYFLLYETMLPSVIFARDKWLKKDGLMLPGKASIYIAPVFNPDHEDRIKFWDDIDAMYEVNMSCLKPLASCSLNTHVHIHQVEQQDIISHASELCTLDLHSITTEQLRHIQGSFSFDCFGSGSINGIVAWFEVFFNKDVTLSTSPYKRPTHWQQSILYLNKTVPVKQGTIVDGTLELKPNNTYHRFLDIALSYKIGGESEEQNFLMDDFIS